MNHTVFQLFRNYRGLHIVKFNKSDITYIGFYTKRNFNISLVKCIDYSRYCKTYKLLYRI